MIPAGNDTALIADDQETTAAMKAIEGDYNLYLTLLVALQNDSPYQAVEIDRSTGGVAWSYHLPGLRTTRDADRLPNGNTLLQGVMEGDEETVIFEVTPGGEIVWRLMLLDAPANRSPGWFYKAQRI